MYSITQFNKYRKARRANFVNQGFCSEGCGRKLVLKWTCRECADKINKYAKNWRNKDIIKHRKTLLIRNRKYRYGGFWEQIMIRDNYSCQICGYNKKVIIHHIDENSKNNCLDNLIVLCRICHTVIERINKTKPNLSKILHY